jgi:hypothetical protein
MKSEKRRGEVVSKMTASWLPWFSEVAQNMLDAFTRRAVVHAKFVIFPVVSSRRVVLHLVCFG